MKFNGDYLFRVRVLSYPAGSHHEVDYGGETWEEPVPGWRPPGWRPEGNYTQIMGTDEFVWPVTHHTYGSRSTAKKRAQLLESYGATVVVERSSRITWPDREPETSALIRRANASVYGFTFYADPELIVSADHNTTVVVGVGEDQHNETLTALQITGSGSSDTLFTVAQLASLVEALTDCLGTMNMDVEATS